MRLITRSAAACAVLLAVLLAAPLSPAAAGGTPAPKATLTGQGVCTPDGWLVTVTLTSQTDKQLTVARAAAATSPTGPRLTVQGLTAGTTLDAKGATATGTVTLPETARRVFVAVQVTWEGQHGTRKQWVHAKTTAPTCEAQPQVGFVDNCTGTTVQLSNGADATRPARFTVTYEETAASYAVNPGASIGVDVPDGAGQITVTSGELRRQWTWQRPGNCPTTPATPTPTTTVPGGNEPTLPVTGAPALALTGIAALVLLAGFAAVVVSRRRRRTTFTAE